MEIMGIVGARAGSKGLPGKNIRALAGKPLLAHAIEAAGRCRHVNRVLLSTDSEEYAAIGRRHGADAPFLRPAEHATDTAIELGYIRHALSWLDENEGYRPDIVVRLCPTTPLVRPADVDRCLELLMEDAEAHSAILMSPAREHPRKAVKIAADGVHAVSYISERGRDVAPSNRQSYAEPFNRQGLPVASRWDTVMKMDSQTGDLVRFLIVPAATAFDIDTEDDFLHIEALLADRG